MRQLTPRMWRSWRPLRLLIALALHVAIPTSWPDGTPAAATAYAAFVAGICLGMFAPRVWCTLRRFGAWLVLCPAVALAVRSGDVGTAVNCAHLLLYCAIFAIGATLAGR